MVDVVLPALAVTIGRSLRRRPILVAHPGRVHVGLVVRSSLRRRLTGALSRATAPGVAQNVAGDLWGWRPEVIHFRWATSHRISVVGDHVTLVVRVAEGSASPGLQVECRVDAALLRQLARARRCHRSGPIDVSWL